MLGFLIAPLTNTLRPHVALSKTRLATLSVLLVGLANCRAVNLGHLASQFPGAALHASNHRRPQRFFQHVRLDECVVVLLVVRIPGLAGPKVLALDLDRTNRKPGSRSACRRESMSNGRSRLQQSPPQNPSGPCAVRGAHFRPDTPSVCGCPTRGWCCAG